MLKLEVGSEFCIDGIEYTVDEIRTNTIICHYLDNDGKVQMPHFRKSEIPIEYR